MIIHFEGLLTRPCLSEYVYISSSEVAICVSSLDFGHFE